MEKDYKFENGTKPSHIHMVPSTEKTQSETLPELFKALSKAQGDMGTAKKDSKNPFFKSSYADLSSCWETCRKPLADNGLAVIQSPVVGPDGTVTIKTYLGHGVSGEWMSSVIQIKLVKNDPQGYGSAMTYARRYGLMAMVGIAPAEDDGNAATHKSPIKQALNEMKFIDKSEAERLIQEAKKSNFDEAGFKRFLKKDANAESVSKVLKSDYKKVLDSLIAYQDVQ